MSEPNIISGTGMVVLVGFGAFLSSIFAPIDLGSKIILFFIGIVMVWLGIYFSKG